MIEDTETLILLNLDPEDLLNICMTDKLSNKICHDINFENNYFKYNNVTADKIENYEDFILTLNELSTIKKVDQELINIDNGNTFEKIYLDENGNEVNVKIKKKGLHWEVKVSRKHKPTGVQIHKDINKLKDLMYNLMI